MRGDRPKIARQGAMRNAWASGQQRWDDARPIRRGGLRDAQDADERHRTMAATTEKGWDSTWEPQPSLSNQN